MARNLNNKFYDYIFVEKYVIVRFMCTQFHKKSCMEFFQATSVYLIKYNATH